MDLQTLELRLLGFVKVFTKSDGEASLLTSFVTTFFLGEALGGDDPSILTSSLSTLSKNPSTQLYSAVPQPPKSVVPREYPLLGPVDPESAAGQYARGSQLGVFRVQPVQLGDGFFPSRSQVRSSGSVSAHSNPSGPCRTW